MPKLTKEQADFLREPITGIVVTLRPDGSPHATPVWVDTDGENVVFNTAEGRAKERHLRSDPRVGVLVMDPTDPYRWLSVSGRAELDEESDVVAHIDSLAHKYLGKEEYGVGPDEQRVIVRVRPEKIDSRGFDD